MNDDENIGVETVKQLINFDGMLKMVNRYGCPENCTICCEGTGHVNRHDDSLPFEERIAPFFIDEHIEVDGTVLL